MNSSEKQEPLSGKSMTRLLVKMINWLLDKLLSLVPFLLMIGWLLEKLLSLIPFLHGRSKGRAAGRIPPNKGGPDRGR